MAFQVIIIGGMYVGSARKKFGVKYPDMGDGRYAAKLTDDQWKEFANNQRVHQNYVEGIASAVTLEVRGRLISSPNLSYLPHTPSRRSNLSHPTPTPRRTDHHPAVRGKQLISGLFFPKASAILGLVYMVGRQVYAAGYSRNGPDGRMYGALLFDLALVGWLGMSVFGNLQSLGYIAK